MTQANFPGPWRKLVYGTRFPATDYWVRTGKGKRAKREGEEVEIKSTEEGHAANKRVKGTLKERGNGEEAAFGF